MENFLFHWKKAILNLLFVIVGFLVSVTSVVALMFLTMEHPILGGVADFMFLSLTIAAFNTYVTR